jgi:hypothetical protein
MAEDDRLWVLEHEHAKPRQWHYYENGHYRLAKCGKPPISGAPICSDKPEATIAETSVCKKCLGL